MMAMSTQLNPKAEETWRRPDILVADPILAKERRLKELERLEKPRVETLLPNLPDPLILQELASVTKF